MKDDCYIVINKKGIQRMTKTPPSLKPEEIMVKVFIDVPNDVFTRPAFNTTISIDKSEIDKLKHYEIELKRIKSI